MGGKKIDQSRVIAVVRVGFLFGDYCVGACPCLSGFCGFGFLTGKQVSVLGAALCLNSPMAYIPKYTPYFYFCRNCNKANCISQSPRES